MKYFLAFLFLAAWLTALYLFILSLGQTHG